MSKDHLADLIAAVSHMREAVRNMGERFELVEIVLKDGYGGHNFDRVMRASPSFLYSASYPDARNAPTVRQMMGVKVTIATPQDTKEG